MNRRKFITIGTMSLLTVAAKPEWAGQKGGKPKDSGGGDGGGDDGGGDSDTTTELYGSYLKGY